MGRFLVLDGDLACWLEFSTITPLLSLPFPFPSLERRYPTNSTRRVLPFPSPLSLPRETDTDQPDETGTPSPLLPFPFSSLERLIPIDSMRGVWYYPRQAVGIRGNLSRGGYFKGPPFSRTANPWRRRRRRDICKWYGWGSKSEKMNRQEEGQ